MRARALMVLGTASHVGKSLTVAALCRILRQDGCDVAPFKAQNMALNSFATAGGGEIGRAQAVQAMAAGVEPHVDMNPLLLKPTSDTSSQVVLEGKVLASLSGAELYARKPQLAAAIHAAYERLAARHRVIVLEGAGSPVEMNLKAVDMVNLSMAEVADARCILVADIDRGGVFASVLGTFDLLTPGERRRFGGFLVNKFRGDPELFAPGVGWLEERSGQPCLGVVPYLAGHGVDEEDGVTAAELPRVFASGGGAGGTGGTGAGGARLRVGVVALPYVSNYTDFRPLAARPDVDLIYLSRAADAAAAHVLILPGTKSTVADLAWLRRAGFEGAIREHLAAGRPVVGICGGFQMMGRTIEDPWGVESAERVCRGLDLLDATTVMARAKVTRQARARFYDGILAASGAATGGGGGANGAAAVAGARTAGAARDQGGDGSDGAGGSSDDDECEAVGYEIHVGDTRLGPGVRPLFRLVRAGDGEARDDGAVSADGRILGTYLHGLFDAPAAAQRLLDHLRRLVHLPPPPPPPAGVDSLDRLADHFRRHLDLAAVYRMLGLAGPTDRAGRA